MAYFAVDGRQMCLALDLWYTHTLSAGSWPVLQAVNIIAGLYICVALWLNPALWLSLFFVFFSCNTESDWSQIHDNIIKKVNSRYNLSGSNTGNHNNPQIQSSHLLKTIFIKGQKLPWLWHHTINTSPPMFTYQHLFYCKEVSQSYKRSFAYS